MNTIRTQWNNMLNRGLMPLFEIQTGEDDYLIVNITLSDDDDCLLFSFDREPLFDVSFSGEIIQVIGDTYQLDLDEYCDNLDTYLQQIYNEVLEGYILPNGLYYDE